MVSRLIELFLTAVRGTGTFENDNMILKEKAAIEACDPNADYLVCTIRKTFYHP